MGGRDRPVRLSNPDKVMFPATGTTKRDVVDYYLRVGPLLLEELRGRPVTRLRCPDGTQGARFVEKNVPVGAPNWLDLVHVRHDATTTAYPLIDSESGLRWLGQLAALELHTPQWRLTGPDRAVQAEDFVPDRLVVDLDPGPGCTLDDCIQTGQQVREVLESLGGSCVPVTSGSKGLHLYAPWPIGAARQPAKTFARDLAQVLAAMDPDHVITSMSRVERAGKVFVDWSQNDLHKTTVTPWSLRAGDLPYVAAPRCWDELVRNPRQLTMTDVLPWVDGIPSPAPGRRVPG